MAPTNRPRLRLHHFVCLLVLLTGLALAACSPPQATPDTADPLTIPTATATVAPPLPDVEAPPELVEQPLQGSPVDVPDVWIVPSRQSKAELAAHLRTDTTQLDWVNPGLPEMVPPGTLVVIPPGYFAQANIVLPDVAASTGLPLETLLAANPGMSVDETVLAGTVLSVPALYFVTEASDVNATANALNLTTDALLSANPQLQGVEELRPGAVLLFVPEGDEE